MPNTAATIPVPPLERRLGGVFLAVMLSLAIAYAFAMSINSDETQHLHVVWGWANGMIPYRDFFDNHSPLFQMLCAPLFRMFGERADIVILMRLAVIPLFAASLWCVYKITASIYSRRSGLWAAVFSGFYPLFFFTSIQFRTDDLWIVFWLLSLSVLAQASFDAKHGLIFGLIFGAAFSVSMKSSLLLVSLLIAGLVVLVFLRLAGGKISWCQISLFMASSILGMILVPGILILFFQSHGALRQMVYCVIEHNTLPGSEAWYHFRPHALRFPIAFPFLVLIGFGIFLSHPDRSIGSRRALIFLTAGFFVAALRSFWPLVTDQDYLPFVPLVFVAITPAILALGDFIGRSRFGFRAAIPLLLVGVEIAWMCHDRHPWENKARQSIDRIADTLRLTDPGDFVMDAKGESIFRKRPFYYVLEGITIHRMEMGLIPDTVAESMIDTGTCVIKPNRLSDKTRRFMDENYVEVQGRMWVAGKVLQKSGTDGKFTFKIEVPARYSIFASNAAVAGTLDGKPYTGSQFLLAGTHEFRRTSGSDHLTVLWAQAVERGFLPVGGKNDSTIE